jgi:Domain of unknown function (DUF6268)
MISVTRRMWQAFVVLIVLGTGLVQAQEAPVFPPQPVDGQFVRLGLPQSEEGGVRPTTFFQSPDSPATPTPGDPVLPPQAFAPAPPPDITPTPTPNPGPTGGSGGASNFDSVGLLLNVLGGGGGMGGVGSKGGVSYSDTYYPSRSVSGQNTNMSFFREKLTVGVPVWEDGCDRVMINAGVSNTNFSTDAILPDSQRPFPTNLWNVTLGASYLHQFSNGWTSMVGANVGSASDDPFHGISEMTVGVNAFLVIPTWNNRDLFMVGAVYSSGGSLNFPVPLAAYLWRPSEQFQANIGIPLSIRWKPNDNWTFTASYVPLYNINAMANYRWSDRLNFYGGYQYLTYTYFLAHREDNSDRFFDYEQHIIVGLRWNLWKKAALDLNTGYAFDQHFGEAQNQGSSLSDRVNIKPGAFVGLNFRVAF